MLRISPQSPVDESSYYKKLYSMEVLHTPEGVKLLAYWLMGIMILLFIILFMPWQQNIRAEGELTALSPQDRPQTVETAIAGRIKEWNISEGQMVDSGQVLVVISEIKEKFFDPELVQRIQEQVTAKEDNIVSKQNKVEALNRQVTALREGLKAKIEQIDQKIIQKQLKLQSDSNDFAASVVDLSIAERQLNGMQSLFDSGLIPLIKLESARSKLQSSKAKRVSAFNKYNASKNELLIAQLDQSTTEAEAMDKIAKSESDRSNTLAEIYDSKGSLAKLKNELVNMTIRNEQYNIRAPQSGFIVKALKTGLGETVKEGEALLTIMPTNPSVAVALYVKPMDVPLLSVGRHVRLEFEGWPALQFTGWPSVSVGTFGGKVEVIDYVNSSNGKYRILVTPDLKKGEQDGWPQQLRLGSGVYGWVMLDDVPVWFELWRQLNGFPPSLRNSIHTTSDGVSDGEKKSDKKSVKVR